MTQTSAKDPYTTSDIRAVLCRFQRLWPNLPKGQASQLFGEYAMSLARGLGYRIDEAAADRRRML